jgi:hypothetical protein
MSKKGEAAIVLHKKEMRKKEEATRVYKREIRKEFVKR